MISHYKPPNMNLWQGRQDASANEYFHQIITPLDLNQPSKTKPGFALLGFCSDTGIKRNLGRPGAIDGPDILKQTLAKLPVHHAFTLYDAGNIVCEDDDLEAAQNSLAEAINFLLANDLTPIVFGGGHETAWGHYQGIEKHLKKSPLKIINFDAHFDLRETLADNKGSSGTPFWQIAQQRQKNNLNFDYYCLGIQRNANTESLFKTADDLNVRYILADEIHQKGNDRCLALIEQMTKSPEAIYLTICLDVFAARIAPGVSAPTPYGLLAEQVLPCLRALAKSKKVLSLDIVELSPKYDIDNHTGKLAANLICDYIHTVTL